jgi:hypothetical protein
MRFRIAIASISIVLLALLAVFLRPGHKPALPDVVEPCNWAETKGIMPCGQCPTPFANEVFDTSGGPYTLAKNHDHPDTYFYCCPKGYQKESKNQSNYLDDSYCVRK